MFVQTIYQSKSRMRITECDIAQITAQSIPNNLGNKISSYLYCDDWNYLHIIEGNAAQVADIMKRIAANKLHHSVKVRLMTRSMKRDFEAWPFGCVKADDFELKRILKNRGYKDLLEINILDAVNVLKRTSGRKIRTMSALEKQSLSDVSRIRMPKPKNNLTEEILGLNS